MKFTKKEKHYLIYLLKKYQKIQKSLWEKEGDSNNLPYQMALSNIDYAIETLLIDLEA